MDPSTNPEKKHTEAPARRISSSELFRENARRIVIQHNGREYVLIITRQGKLVLNRMP